MTAETPTPLTTALHNSFLAPPIVQFCNHYWRMRTHAEKLERRCAELEAENRKWKREHKAMSKGAQTNAEVANIQANKIAELRRDQERLLHKLKRIRDGDYDLTLPRIQAVQVLADKAIRDSQPGDASGEASPPADG